MSRLITIEFDENDKPIGLKEIDGKINLVLPQYADDTEATDDGLVVGDWYQDDNGVVRIVN